MNKNFSLIFFLTRSLFLGVLFSKMYELTGSDSIFAILLGTLIGILFIFILKKKKNDTLLSKIIYFLLVSFFIITCIVILESFVSSFFLTNTPKIIIILPTIILAIYASLKTDEIIKRTANIQIYFSFILIILAILALLKNFSFENIIPLFNTNIVSFFKASLTYGIFSTIPHLLINNDDISLKKHIKYYVITSLINLLINIIILGVLKPSLITSYSFPEYIVLKNIKIGSFIENIENLIASVWYFDLFIMITLSIKKINNVITNHYLSSFYVIILTLFATFIIMKNYYYVLYLYHFSTIILLVFFILFISSVKYK